MAEIREKGETEDLRKDVVALGTGFSLVTDYTSMLVIREDEMENLGIQHNNANWVDRERQARSERAQGPVKNYWVENNPGTANNQGGPRSNSGDMFGWAIANNIGTGPVGCLLLYVITCGASSLTGALIVSPLVYTNGLCELSGIAHGI